MYLIVWMLITLCNQVSFCSFFFCLLNLWLTIKAIITCCSLFSCFISLFSLEISNCTYSQRDLILETLKFLFEANNRSEFCLNLLSHLLFDSLIKPNSRARIFDFCLCANSFHSFFQQVNRSLPAHMPMQMLVLISASLKPTGHKYSAIFFHSTSLITSHTQFHSCLSYLQQSLTNDCQFSSINGKSTNRG